MLVIEGDAHRAAPGRFTFPSGDPVPLAGSTRWRLAVAQGYELVGESSRGARWRARTTGYIYDLIEPNGHYLLSWHWHPESRSPIKWPHLHVHGRVRTTDLSKAHLPSNPVLFPVVLRCLIDDFGVAPRRGDWRTVLEGAIAALEAAEHS